MTASDSVILPINYIIWRKSGPVLTGPTGPAPTPLCKNVWLVWCMFVANGKFLVFQLMHDSKRKCLWRVHFTMIMPQYKC